MTDKQIREKSFIHNPVFNYLPDGDRYLLAKETPKYKFNIIGSGVIGLEHIRLTNIEGRAKIHGLYDPNPRSIAVAKETNKMLDSTNEVVVYETLEEACMDPEVDALILCTPNYTHLEVLRVAVKSGKHIMLEKPIATTVADAVAITEIAESYEAVLQLGLQYRYKAIYSESTYELLTRKSVGEIKMVSIREHRIPFLDKVNQWNKFTKYSGDTLVEKCCHYFDLLNMYAGGRPVSVYASGDMGVNFKAFERDGEKSDILDNAFVIINYDNGVKASFDLCMFAPMFFEELTVCGDNGRLRAYEQHDFMPTPDETFLEIMHDDKQPSRRTIPMYPEIIQNSGHSGATYYEHIYFIDNIEGKETDTATARDGLWSVIVAAAAQESIKQGQVVNINQFLASHGVDL